MVGCLVFKKKSLQTPKECRYKVNDKQLAFGSFPCFLKFYKPLFFVFSNGGNAPFFKWQCELNLGTRKT